MLIAKSTTAFSCSKIAQADGMAAIEIIPIFVILVLLLSFTFGFFGTVHTGILNSIAARNYTFETFRHRSNLTYFKDTSIADAGEHYARVNNRHHGIGSEFGPGGTYRISQRPIDKFGVISFEQGDDQGVHNREVRSLAEDRRNSRVSIHRVWLKTVYGICITRKCSE